jgi:hypothetical protein
MAKVTDSIMEDLRREVHKYVLVEEQQSKQPHESSSILRLREMQTVNSHLPIGWPTMPRDPLLKASAYLQKVTRRLLRWYINPIVDQQNRFNEAVVSAIANLRSASVARDTALWETQERLDAAMLDIERLKLEVESLSKR